MESIRDSNEKATPVDISTLKIGDIFTIADNPFGTEDEQYRYRGYLPGPKGNMHIFETTKEHSSLRMAGGWGLVKITEQPLRRQTNGMKVIPVDR